jgi:hypothetical protein
MFEPGIGWWSDLARAIFQPDGGPGSFQVEELIRAVAVLEGERPEWARLKGERRWITTNTGQGPGGAGNFSYLAVENPLNSGVVVVVDGFVNTQTGVQFSRRRLPDAVYTAGKTSDVTIVTLLDTFDYPAVGEPNSAAHIVTGIVVGAALPGTPSGLRAAGTGASDQAPDQIGFPLAILHPGSYVAAQTSVANTTIGGYFYGRERPLFKPARGV